MIELVYLTISNYIVANLNLILSLVVTSIIYKFFSLRITYIDGKNDSVNAERLLNYINSDDTHCQFNYIYDGTIYPNGYCINKIKKFIAFITYNNDANMEKLIPSIYIIGQLPSSIKKDPIQIKEKDECIELYLSNPYFGSSPKLIKLPFANFEPRTQQLEIMNNIKDTYDNHPFHICRTLIYGEPGKGKSFIAKLLAKEMDCKLSFDIRLDEPGNPIMKLWKTEMPTKECPLIVQIDEFDIFIDKVHNEKIKNDHRWLRTIITNKQSYNTFMSEYLICLPYVIYIFTMNCHPDDINSLDSSYIRKNRIDIIQEY